MTVELNPTKNLKRRAHKRKFSYNYPDECRINARTGHPFFVCDMGRTLFHTTAERVNVNRRGSNELCVCWRKRPLPQTAADSSRAATWWRFWLRATLNRLAEIIVPSR
ncbi:hypothetical protein TNIN_18741 [Trichonephila inaurata madagascariensis]|uniref:Uncharacterized protein n=1 Tax=Trichonephila inaurata madagascariensis TaxID=2747483 RepID=A0A8X6J9I4_9ARAC|nr:hypothetical protein TNIN_18741 [Trichonephila inaurata madagascariensis]